MLIELETNETLININIYKEENNDMKLNYIFDDKIINAIIDKEIIIGTKILKNWEQLIYYFYQIYIHATAYKYNNIDELMVNHYYTYSRKEQEEIYIQLFQNLEEDILESISTLRKYQDLIKDNELNYILNLLQGVYNKKNISMKEKNQLYLKTNGELDHINFNRIYTKILECINQGIIN